MKETNTRNATLDMMKGIGIILMVIGHSGSPLTNFIYLFHMALFFIISGFFLKGSDTDSFDNVMAYGIRKIKSLYIPCVTFNGILTLGNNILYRLSIVNEYYTLSQTTKQLVKCVLFSGGGYLGGATWFLRTMFMGCLFYTLTEWLLKKIQIKYLEVTKTLIFLFILFLVWIIPNDIIEYKYLNCLTELPLLQIGHLIRENKVKINSTLGVISFVFLFIINIWGCVDISLNKNMFGNPLVFVLCSCAGFALIFAVSNKMKKFNIVKRIICYIGKNTMPILLLHFIAFKIVILIQIAALGLKIDKLSSFPIYYLGGMWWCAYTFIGVTVPILLNYGYQTLKSIWCESMNCGRKK